MLDVLGTQWFAEVDAVKITGKVIWCNFDLARELGFDVPPSNRLTAQFHEQLIDALAYRVLEPGEDVAARKTIKLYADKYGGEGVSPALGAGRAGFLPYGNLYLKGIGLTPLFRQDNYEDFEHSHGGVPIDEALAEALFGEVNTNLFTRGSTRILAIIDYGEFITYPKGNKIARVLAVRAGSQLRPAHLLVKPLKRSKDRLEVFIRMTRDSGQLVMRKNPAGGEDVADIRATMLRVIDDHAQTSAEQFRWRMLHGALSSSNMEISGAMLDLATQSMQPRTAPIYVLQFPDSIYGREHIERAIQLRPIYRVLVRSTPHAQRELLNAKPINFLIEMDNAYHKHLQLKLLGATGLKAEVARRLQAGHADITRRFTETVLKMSQLKNPGGVNAGRTPVAAVSVLDVFRLFRIIPALYFAAPLSDQTAQILDGLQPIFKGNRFHMAYKQAAVKALVREFAENYCELMRACEAFAAPYYDDAQSMQESIKARAAFENEPINSLYRANIYKEFEQASATYQATGDDAVFREIIDRKVFASLRNADALLSQGTSRRLDDGGIELERRTINGVNYSVRAWNDEAQKRRLHVSLAVKPDAGAYVTALPGEPLFTVRQIKSLRYHFTTDGWATSGKVSAQLVRDSRGHHIIDFEDISIFPRIGRLDGAFCVGPRRTPIGTATHGEYPFAIPDKRELMHLTKGQTRRRPANAPSRQANQTVFPQRTSYP